MNHGVIRSSVFSAIYSLNNQLRQGLLNVALLPFFHSRNSTPFILSVINLAHDYYFHFVSKDLLNPMVDQNVAN